MTEVIEEDVTATTEEAVKPPKSTKEVIQKAMKRGEGNEKHEAFAKWLKDEGDTDVDINGIIAAQSLYQAFRKTDVFQEIDERLKAEGGSKTSTVTDVEPKTPEEIRAAAEKAKANAERQAKAAQRAAERAQRANELLAKLESGQLDVQESPSTNGDVPAEAEDVPEDTSNQPF